MSAHAYRINHTEYKMAASQLKAAQGYAKHFTDRVQGHSETESYDMSEIDTLFTPVSSRFISSVDLADGVVTILIKAVGPHKYIKGKSLIFTPVYSDQDVVVDWSCVTTIANISYHSHPFNPVQEMDYPISTCEPE